MCTIETILRRRSVRAFSDRTVSEADLRAILEAGMSGPSCVNARDWSFLVVRDKNTLQKMADANGRPAEPLRGADFAVLICGDLERAFPPAREYWVIDGAIAAQNMTLAAASLGIGSVWLGTWPQMDRVEKQAALFHLPETQVPHSILAFGYPTGENALDQDRPSRWEEGRVHWEQWEA